MNDQLLSPFTGEEIRKALTDMNPTKAPGPDGLLALFFQKYQDIIGEDILQAVLNILNAGGDVTAWNSSLITLFPKMKNPTIVKEFRTISLCNVLYKIMSKAIINRFRLVLDEVIGDSQNAFVPGSLITDNILLGFEAVNWTRHHSGSKT